MYFVYVLKSVKDKKHYIGYANNLKKRLERHNLGVVRSTKYRRPLRLIYEEKVSSKLEVRKRENQLKKMKGDIQFKQLLINAGVAQR